MTIFLTGLLTCLALIVAIGAQSLFIMRQAIRRDRLMLALAVCLAGDIVLIFSGTAGVGVVAERAPWVLQVLTWGGVAYLLWFAVSSFRSAFARQRAEPSLPDAGPDAAAVEVPVGGSLDVRGAVDGGGAVGRQVAVGEDGADVEWMRAPDGEPAERGHAVAAGDGADVVGGAVATKPALAVTIRGERTAQDEQVGHPAGHPAGGPVGRAVGRTLTPVHIVVLTALSVSMLNPHAILDTVVMLGTLANSYGADKWVFATGAVTGSALWFLTLGLGTRALAPLLDTPRTWRIVDVVVGVVMVAIAAKLALG